jgi:hypothetical protein
MADNHQHQQQQFNRSSIVGDEEHGSYSEYENAGAPANGLTCGVNYDSAETQEAELASRRSPEAQAALDAQ